MAGFLTVGLSENLHAQTFTVTSSAPTPGSDDIDQIGTPAGGNPSGPGGAYSNFYTDYVTEGETFTTGSNAGGYILNSITLQLDDAGNASGTTPTVSVFSITSAPTAGTADSGSFNTTPLSTANYSGPAFASGNYLTFNLATPLTLSANTLYGFGYKTGDSYGSGIYSRLAFADADAPASGNLVSFNQYSETVGTMDAANSGQSLQFDVGLTAVTTPEPSAWLLLGVGVLGLAFVRHRTTQAKF